MILRLTQHPGGVTTEPGDRVVYDVDRDEAHFGAATVDGHALVWELTERPEGDWVVRCDRVDFPPGGVAYLHTHPGPGLRVLLKGRIRIETQGASHEYGPFDWWYETGPDPVYAAASRTEETGFVRVLVLPAEWAGKRTISYVDPADDEKPKLQRARVYLEHPLSRRLDGGEPRAEAPASPVPERVLRRRGGKLLVDQLAVHGTDTVFCVPGESFLEVLDGLYESPLRLIICRHEAGAANMADAYGKLTGRPGICIVTRGPGATHASVGVHTAFQDSTPLILLVGQVASHQEEREAFQEVDYRRMFGPLAKWVAQIDRVDRIPEYLHRAFSTACAGRPGPVVLALPEDMLSTETDAADSEPFNIVQPHPGPEQVERVRELLARAERPFVLLGGAGWTPRASADLRAFLEANELPAGAAFRRQDSLDNDSPSYAGDVGIGINPKLAQRVRDADLLLVVGPRLDEMTTSGYTLVDAQTLVHVHPGAEELGRVYRPALPILSGPEPFAAAVRDLRVEPRWRDWTRDVRTDYEEWQRHDPMPGALDLGDCIAHLREKVPDAIVTNGAGNFTTWVHRFWRWHDYPTQLAPTSGAMGYGVPAAVAAKAVAPERTVICFAGDGDFLMSGQELATAVQHDLAVIVLVVNNGMYGTIRMQQEQHFPGRVVGTDLVNPDFAAYARAFGAFGETVTETSAFAGAFERALAAGTPALLELRIDPDAINPRTTLSAIRADAIR